MKGSISLSQKYYSLSKQTKSNPDYQCLYISLERRHLLNSQQNKVYLTATLELLIGINKFLLDAIKPFSWDLGFHTKGVELSVECIDSGIQVAVRRAARILGITTVAAYPSNSLRTHALEDFLAARVIEGGFKSKGKISNELGGLRGVTLVTIFSKAEECLSGAGRSSDGSEDSQSGSSGLATGKVSGLLLGGTDDHGGAARGGDSHLASSTA